jgi:hypothetical protein
LRTLYFPNMEEGAKEIWPSNPLKLNRPGKFQIASDLQEIFGEMLLDIYEGAVGENLTKVAEKIREEATKRIEESHDERLERILRQNPGTLRRYIAAALKGCVQVHHKTKEFLDSLEGIDPEYCDKQGKRLEDTRTFYANPQKENHTPWEELENRYLRFLNRRYGITSNEKLVQIFLNREGVARFKKREESAVLSHIRDLKRSGYLKNRFSKQDFIKDNKLGEKIISLLSEENNNAKIAKILNDKHPLPGQLTFRGDDIYHYLSKTESSTNPSNDSAPTSST